MSLMPLVSPQGGKGCLLNPLTFNKGVPIITLDMTTAEAIKRYKTQKGLADALGIKQGSVSGWGEYPPPLRQLQIQRITNGRLRAEPNVFDAKAA
jgi:hypothetical protein